MDGVQVVFGVGEAGYLGEISFSSRRKCPIPSRSLSRFLLFSLLSIALAGVSVFGLEFTYALSAILHSVKNACDENGWTTYERV
jgi:hypothetical protein